jgi:hypothetical protein
MDSVPQRRVATISAALGCAAATTFFVAILFAENVDRARALPFITVWTLAPYLALLAIRRLSRGATTAVVALALVIELTSYISMGGGFVYALLCGPLLLIALVAMTTSRMG